jgi:hypothetical protein
MTLPGLNGIARTAGLVAIMCSVLSMTIYFIAIIRYRAELTHGELLIASMSLCLRSSLLFLSAEVCSYLSRLYS